MNLYKVNPPHDPPWCISYGNYHDLRTVEIARELGKLKPKPKTNKETCNRHQRNHRKTKLQTPCPDIPIRGRLNFIEGPIASSHIWVFLCKNAASFLGNTMSSRQLFLKKWSLSSKNVIQEKREEGGASFNDACIVPHIKVFLHEYCLSFKGISCLQGNL